MKINHVLLISLLIAGLLFVPVVSAEEIYNETYKEVGSGNYEVLFNDYRLNVNVGPSTLVIYPLEAFRGLNLTMVTGQVGGYYSSLSINSDICDFTYNGEVIGTGECGHYCCKLDGINYIVYWVTFDEINLPSGTGYAQINIVTKTKPVESVLPPAQYAQYAPSGNEPYIAFCTPSGNILMHSGLGQFSTAYFTKEWSANLKLIKKKSTTEIVLDSTGPTNIEVKLLSDDSLIYEKPLITSDSTVVLNALFPIITDVYSPYFDRHYIATHYLDGASTTMRTGTVTMTDHNGTRISGFEVKAVNYYTGEVYTASTDSDVATITLPMDHTTSFRNPQTGQYEDVPVGYYTFFVSKPGYKMTSEDGVRISVLPEEYSSYHLGDIIVTSEDGYLTGKHLFQIRSRADMRILQTGTISAQSATTGEWYNTTVVNGLATLILPYDTSSAISKYVGNYYVYATSPGYIPSEYATQISVRPDTQSEIHGILLTPIGGIPEAGNVTLRIQAFSDSWQEIPNAEIHIDGVEGQGWEIWDTYTASSTGYAEISVPGNSTYDITVYGQGYYSSSQRVEVGDTDPQLNVFILYPTGAPTLTPPTTQPTGWITPIPTTQPPDGIPDEDDKSEGFLMEAVRGISKIFGVGFATGKTILGMLLALAIGFTTAKKLRGGAAEFGMGLLGGTMLGVLIGLLPVWVVVVLLLIVGMYVGYRYVGGGNNG